MPVSNRAQKLKILKKLRKDGSIFGESFIQSQNVTAIKKVTSLFPSNVESEAKLEVFLKILSSRMFISSKFIFKEKSKRCSFYSYSRIGSIERALNQRPYFETPQRLVRASAGLVFLTIREEESHAPSKREIKPIYLPLR